MGNDFVFLISVFFSFGKISTPEKMNRIGIEKMVWQFDFNLNIFGSSVYDFDTSHEDCVSLNIARLVIVVVPLVYL